MSTDQSDPAVAAAVPVAAAAEGERIGRFTRAELEAMRGKRGRKPVEYYQVFPRPPGEGGEAAPAASGAPKAPRKARAPKLPAVSSAVIGDHTIDELLAMIGGSGRKPVAYEILQQAAQVFADLGAVTLPPPPVAEVDPLAEQLAAATPQVRETIAGILALTVRAPRKPRTPKVEAAPEAPAAQDAPPVAG